MRGTSTRVAIATVLLGLVAGVPASADPIGLSGMPGRGGVPGAPRVLPMQVPAREQRRRQRTVPRTQTGPGATRPENPHAPVVSRARPAPPRAMQRQELDEPEHFEPEGMEPDGLEPEAFDPRLEQFQPPPEQVDFEDQGLRGQIGPGAGAATRARPPQQMEAPEMAPPPQDPRRLIVSSNPGRGGIRPEVMQRLQMVEQMLGQGALEMASDFIPHPGQTQLTGAERKGFDRLAGQIAKQARTSARKEAKKGNIGAGRPKGWQQALASEMQLPDYTPGTALDSLRAIDNLKEKGLGGGVLSSFGTARALRKAEKSIQGWTKRHFWQRRNAQVTAAAIGALIERGASERVIGRAVKKTYGEFMTIASRDSRTGDVDSALAALSFVEKLAQSQDVPEGVRADLQRKLQRDDRKIRKTRLKAYKVGIQYMVNMASRQRNMKMDEAAEQILGQVFYMARKYSAIKKAGGADVPPEVLLDRDGQPMPVTIDEVRRHLGGFGPNNLYTRRVLSKMVRKYGEKAQALATQRVVAESEAPQLEAQLQEIDGQLQMLDEKAEEANEQLLAQGKTQDEAIQILDQQIGPVYQQLIQAQQQIVARLQGAQAHAAAPAMDMSGDRAIEKAFAARGGGF